MPRCWPAFGAFLGHLFPVWLKFKGGKGVATYIGVLIGLFWPAAIVFCVMWLATAATTRYSSLSALIAAFVTPLFLWWFGHPALASLFVVHDAVDVLRPPRKHQAAAGRHRKQDRREMMPQVRPYSAGVATNCRVSEFGSIASR